VVVDVVLELEVLGHDGRESFVQAARTSAGGAGSCTFHTTIGTAQISHSAIQHRSSS
jgi:hypothetical protein